MPGLFPGRVIETFHERAVVNRRVSADAVRDMVSRGMLALTGDTRPQDAWARFFDKSDVVGIKVNPSGTPQTTTQIALLREVIRSLNAVGVANTRIIVYDRNSNQLEVNGYHALVPPGVRVIGLDQEWRPPTARRTAATIARSSARWIASASARRVRISARSSRRK